jgi:hypothetical protein
MTRCAHHGLLRKRWQEADFQSCHTLLDCYHVAGEPSRINRWAVDEIGILRPARKSEASEIFDALFTG